MKTQRAADIAVGCLVAALGVFVLFASMWISVAGVHRPSPGTFPYTGDGRSGLSAREMKVRLARDARRPEAHETTVFLMTA